MGRKYELEGFVLQVLPTQIRGTCRNGFTHHVPSPDRSCSRNRVPKVALSEIIPYLASEGISLRIVSGT